jgi:hypothetical protein
MIRFHILEARVPLDENVKRLVVEWDDPTLSSFGL